MQKPLQISEGGSPKRDEHFSCGAFQSRGDQLYGKNVHLPREWFGTPEMAVVSLFWDTKGAFDWEIWI